MDSPFVVESWDEVTNQWWPWEGSYSSFHEAIDMARLLQAAEPDTEFRAVSFQSNNPDCLTDAPTYDVYYVKDERYVSEVLWL